MRCCRLLFAVLSAFFIISNSASAQGTCTYGYNSTGDRVYKPSANTREAAGDSTGTYNAQQDSIESIHILDAIPMYPLCSDSIVTKWLRLYDSCHTEPVFCRPTIYINNQMVSDTLIINKIRNNYHFSLGPITKHYIGPYRVKLKYYSKEKLKTNKYKANEDGVLIIRTVHNKTINFDEF